MPKHKVIKVGFALAAQLTLALLTGCAVSDDKMAGFLVAPGKFELYTCPELVEQAKASAQRQRELEALMAKAGQGSGGQLVSTLAYRPDYLSAKGEMKDVRDAAAAKNCDMAAINNATADVGISAPGTGAGQNGMR